MEQRIFSIFKSNNVYMLMIIIIKNEFFMSSATEWQ